MTTERLVKLPPLESGDRFRGDMIAVLQVLQQGVASSKHQTFVETLD